MVDVLTVDQRRLNMSRIRGRDTKPEMLIRQGLHGRGLRYRLQDRGLPGRPDLVFSKAKVAIFVHGCFWHGHTCPMFKLPSTRADFWAAKIDANRARDARVKTALMDLDWRVLTVWECSLKGPARWPVEGVLDCCNAFLASGDRTGEIKGRWT